MPANLRFLEAPSTYRDASQLEMDFLLKTKEIANLKDIDRVAWFVLP